MNHILIFTPEVRNGDRKWQLLCIFQLWQALAEVRWALKFLGGAFLQNGITSVASRLISFVDTVLADGRGRIVAVFQTH